MKGILLGSTAVMSAVLLSAPAMSEEPVTLSIGGRYAAGAGFLIGQDDGVGEPGHNSRDYGFRQDVEVHILGSTTLDNGLTVGVEIELEGQQSGDQIDQVWAYVESESFGQLRFGDTDEALGALCYLTPFAGNLFGVDSPYFEFNNALRGGIINTNSTCFGLDGNATKIAYFSPTFGGFHFAVSWTPDDFGEDTYSGFTGAVGGGAGGTPSHENPGDVSDTFSIAADFSQDYEDFGFVVGAGFSTGEHEAVSSNEDLQNYNAYGQIYFGGWLIGASFGYLENYSAVTPDLDLWVAGVGVVYSWDQWSASLSYSHGDYELASPTDIRLDIVQLTGSYALGPGLSLDAMIGYASQEDDEGVNFGGAPGDYDTLEIGFGFFIQF